MRIWIAVLSMFIILASAPTAPAAASSAYETYAKQLQKMGLFQGTGSGFELERAPTRLEAVVMLIRLLGRESDALAQAPGAHPFRDVPAWADKFVSYAYQNKLAAGVAADQFGSQQLATVEQYCTFVLRALGYDDSQKDFDWRRSVQFIAQIGLQPQQFEENPGPFLRAHMVEISYHALALPLKDQAVTLLEKLENEGVVAPAESVGEEGTTEAPVAEGEQDENVQIEEHLLTVPVTLKQVGTETRYIIEKSTLLQYFPKAHSISMQYDSGVILNCDVSAGSCPQAERGTLSSEDQLKVTILKNLIADQRIRLSELKDNTAIMLSDKLMNSVSIWDGNDTLLAVAVPDALSIERREFTFLTDHTMILQKAQPERDVVLANIHGAVYFPNSPFYSDTVETKTLGPDGLSTSKLENTLLVDRTALPVEAQAFTKITQAVYNGDTGSKMKTDEASMRKLLEYWATQVVLNKMRNIPLKTYQDEVGLLGFGKAPQESLQLPSSVNVVTKPTFILLMLQDDHGKVLAYTYFNEQDIRSKVK